ncbi:MAG: fructose bisphosphate aldolase [Gammaproteobacteria bacterium TMED1]|nr:MAG: fructose bisphosphate aldolase [Gammaproteobacteria bacterium TMED1]
MLNQEQRERMSSAQGFIAALDQSGGSTPKALSLYGIDKDKWSNDIEMFALVHEMRTRIITSDAFDGKDIIAAILFAHTMNNEIENRPTAEYLWEEKNIIPILKVDSGLAEEFDGVQLMKPIEKLDQLLMEAKSKGIFGTKMRSVIKTLNIGGIKKVVEQQFKIARHIIQADLVPIIEPEVDIHANNKSQIENILRSELLYHLDQLGTDAKVMLKLTLPDTRDFYLKCVEHPAVLRVLALSGGYSREESNKRLTEQKGVVASFSRALTEGLKFQQSDEDFNAILKSSIRGIVEASST